MLTDEDGGLILCNECTRTSLTEAYELQQRGSSQPQKKSKASSGAAAVSGAESQASSAFSTGPTLYKAPTRALKRSRAQPKRPMNSYESLLDWCITLYHDAHVDKNLPLNSGNGSNHASLALNPSPLDSLVESLPLKAKKALRLGDKPASGGKSAAAKPSRRKQTRPKRLSITRP